MQKRPGEFDEIVHALEIKAEHLELPAETGLNPTSRDDCESEGLIRFTVDSGATAIIISTYDEWMLDVITDENPRIGVEVADGVQLQTKKIGIINRRKTEAGKLGLKAFSLVWDKKSNQTRIIWQKMQYPQLK